MWSGSFLFQSWGPPCPLLEEACSLQLLHILFKHACVWQPYGCNTHLGWCHLRLFLNLQWKQDMTLDNILFISFISDFCASSNVICWLGGTVLARGTVKDYLAAQTFTSVAFDFLNIILKHGNKPYRMAQLLSSKQAHDSDCLVCCGPRYISWQVSGTMSQCLMLRKIQRSKRWIIWLLRNRSLLIEQQCMNVRTYAHRHSHAQAELLLTVATCQTNF